MVTFMTSRYAAPDPRSSSKRPHLRTAALTAAVVAGAALLAGCSQAPVGYDTLVHQVQTATVPAPIASTLSGMEVQPETLDLPTALEDPGTISVLWEESDSGWSDPRAAAVVYSIDGDGQLTALRYCPMSGEDIYHASKGDRHPISNSIDSQTTSIRCETNQEAASRGRPNPMLIVKGRSGGMLGSNLGKGNEVSREFGIL